MRVVIFDSPEEVCRFAADAVCHIISERERLGGNAVLGLATGGTPLGLYQELIRRCSKGDVSFHAIESFNLDEYVGLAPTDPQSYHFYMNEHLFRHIDIDPERTHVPQTHEVDLAESAKRYEEMIKRAGGIDLQILGIGTDGHIGFNEIGSSLGSRTRVKSLTQRTRLDNARYFYDIDHVPTMALTMGIATILDSRSILLMANGASKASAIRQCVEGPITASLPASALQLHPNVTLAIDSAAAGELQHADYYVTSERNRVLFSRSS